MIGAAVLIAVQTAVVLVVGTTDPQGGIVLAGIFSLVNTALAVVLPYLLRRRRTVSLELELEDELEDGGADA